MPTTQPSTLEITHVGSGQQFTQALTWRKTASGGLSAKSSFAIPPGAKLGSYQVQLRGAENEKVSTPATSASRSFACRAPRRAHCPG